MGIGSPFMIVDGFCTSRPPILVFTISLIAFALASFALGVFIQNTDSIPNPEIRNDWKKFLGHLSKLDLCASVADNVKHEKVFWQNGEESGNASITVRASMKLVEELTKLPSQPIALHGVIELGEWASFCHNGEHTVIKHLGLKVVLPHNLTQANPQEVCVVLYGPPSLLPFNQHSTVCIPPVIDENTTLVGTLTGVDKLYPLSMPVNLLKKKSTCENGSQIAVEYLPESEQVILLTKQERIIIKMHLFHTSFFLLCISLAFGLFAMFKRNIRPKVFMLDEVPLNQA